MIVDSDISFNFKEGIQPDIEVHQLSFSEKKSDGESCSLDEQSHSRMNVYDEPEQETEEWNNNRQTGETHGETSGQSGDVHSALDTNVYSGIQGPVIEATHEQQQTMVDPESAGESQPLSARTVKDTEYEAVKACIDGVCEQEKVNIVQPAECVEQEIREKGHTEEDQVSLYEADDHLELVSTVHIRTNH